MKLSPIENGFGMIVSDVSLRGEGLHGIVRQIEQALDEHLLLVFRDTGLAYEDYVAFGRLFGELEDFGRFRPGTGASFIGTISNLAPDGSIMSADTRHRLSVAADGFWHTDHTYMTKRARYSMLLAEIIPAAGGATEFCDTRAAYDALPAARKAELDDLVAVHSLIYSRSLTGYTDWGEDQRKMLPPVPQPLVFRNPNTGRRSLYVASHIAEVLGWPTAKARELAAELIAFAAQPGRTYAHAWRPGDLAIWDDRATMHRRGPYDDLTEKRRLHTLRVIEPSPLYDPAVLLEIH